MMVFMLTERVLVVITDSEIMFVIDLYFSMLFFSSFLYNMVLFNDGYRKTVLIICS